MEGGDSGGGGDGCDGGEGGSIATTSGAVRVVGVRLLRRGCHGVEASGDVFHCTGL